MLLPFQNRDPLKRKQNVAHFGTWGWNDWSWWNQRISCIANKKTKPNTDGIRTRKHGALLESVKLVSQQTSTQTSHRSKSLKHQDHAERAGAWVKNCTKNNSNNWVSSSQNPKNIVQGLMTSSVWWILRFGTVCRFGPWYFSHGRRSSPGRSYFTVIGLGLEIMAGVAWTLAQSHLNGFYGWLWLRRNKLLRDLKYSTTNTTLIILKQIASLEIVCSLFRAQTTFLLQVRLITYPTNFKHVYKNRIYQQCSRFSPVVFVFDANQA